MITKFHRGSIWWCDLPKMWDYTHIQYGKRPLIIISSNEENAKNGTVTVVPMTSQYKEEFGDRMSIVFQDDTKSYLMPENIRTVDTCRLYSYCGLLDEDTMAEVDKVVKKYLHLDVIDVEDETLHTLKQIARLLESMEERKVEEVAKSIEKDKELKIAINDVKRQASKYAGMSAIEKFNARYSQTQEQKNDSVNSTTKIKWTIEKKKQLVEEYAKCEKADRPAMAEKWNLVDVKRLSSYVSQFKKDLKNISYND